MNKNKKHRVVKSLNPGANGTKDFHDILGDLLVKVRYCKDDTANENFKTIEIKVNEHDVKQVLLNIGKKRHSTATP